MKCLALPFRVLLAICAITLSMGVSLDEVSLQYNQTQPGSRDTILYPLGYQVNQELNLNLNVALFPFLYVNNQVHSLTDTTQFRLVGWHWQLGVHLCQQVDLYADHFSQHLLDAAPPGWNYPVTDAIGVKVYLFKANSKGSIF